MSDWISWNEHPPSQSGEWSVIEWIVCHDEMPEDFTGVSEVLFVRKQYHTLEQACGMHWLTVLGYADDRHVYSFGMSLEPPAPWAAHPSPLSSQASDSRASGAPRGTGRRQPACQIL